MLIFGMNGKARMASKRIPFLYEPNYHINMMMLYLLNDKIQLYGIQPILVFKL